MNLSYTHHQIGSGRQSPDFRHLSGIQVLNVVNGGTLYQDIFSEISTTPLLKHRQQAP
jgi:hypothetical protein